MAIGLKQASPPLLCIPVTKVGGAGTSKPLYLSLRTLPRPHLLSTGHAPSLALLGMQMSCSDVMPLLVWMQDGGGGEREQKVACHFHSLLHPLLPLAPSSAAMWPLECHPEWNVALRLKSILTLVGLLSRPSPQLTF